MEIKFINFSDNVHNIDLCESTKNLGLEEPFFGEALLNCKMDKTPVQVILNCNLKVKAKLNCDRCMEKFESVFENNFQLSYFFGYDSEASESDNVFYLPLDSVKIKLDQEVREYSVLSVSMKKLCNEDCKGLCPICGVNLNDEDCNCVVEKTKPVWDQLKKLKDITNK